MVRKLKNRRNLSASLPVLFVLEKKNENNHQEKKHEQSKKMSQTLTRGSSAIVIASACSAFSLRFVSTNVHMVFSHSGTGWYEK